MIKNKRKQDTNVGCPIWSYTHLWLDPQQYCHQLLLKLQSTARAHTWVEPAKYKRGADPSQNTFCLSTKHKAESTVKEHSTLVPHSDLRLGGSLILMLLKLSWVSSGFVSPKPIFTSETENGRFLRLSVYSAYSTSTSSISKNGASKDGGLDGDVG